jgi:hypothetical protein
VRCRGSGGREKEGSRAAVIVETTSAERDWRDLGEKGRRGRSIPTLLRRRRTLRKSG